jgi:hypothetical protein
MHHWIMTAIVLSAANPERLEPVPFTDVRVEDRFWSPRLQTSREVTIPYCFGRCQETGRLANFARAAGLEEGPFQGIYFDDSDVYKVIEGAAYALAARPDPDLDGFLDGLIARIAAAQQPDGYLNTYHTLVTPDTRWTDIARLHELYCAGHLFEAAVAHHRATGKRSLLDVAIRFADHIDAVFGPDGRTDPPGHQEIEIGLVKLFQVTGERRYLELARFFIDQRGRGAGRTLYGPYAQDHIPVTEHTAPVGHAVRAMYLYCGMADVAALTRDEGYMAALHRVWSALVSTQLYITGGVGARSQGEAFGDAYELPNQSAYCETCAAIGNAFFNQRMHLLTGDAKYVDVLERVLYNGLLSGVALSGDRFFYPNPLASAGNVQRSPWFSCACCPVNVARFIPSIGGYVYARGAAALYVNLYVGGGAETSLGGTTVRLEQETEYPWDGRVTIAVNPEQPAEFDLMLRVPGWARGASVPGDLYQEVQRGRTTPPPRVSINSTAVATPLERGYLRVRRRWSAGDRVQLDLPMPVRLTRAHASVEANRARVAIERGPIVYCVEAVDQPDGRVHHLWLPADAAFSAEHRPDLLGGVTVLRTEARAQERGAGDAVRTSTVALTAVPYHVWAHRGAGEMAVWIPTDPALARAAPAPTLASTSAPSASHCFEHDTVHAVNDQMEPASSADHGVPRFTWWDRRGTTEWVQYDFPEPRLVSAVAVYWFDDTGVGECRVPAAWRVLHRREGQWRPVTPRGPAGVAPDRLNRLEFESVRTDALRIEVDLREGFSGGILEWTVE